MPDRVEKIMIESGNLSQSAYHAGLGTGFNVLDFFIMWAKIGLSEK